MTHNSSYVYIQIHIFIVYKRMKQDNNWYVIQREYHTQTRTYHRHDFIRCHKHIWNKISFRSLTKNKKKKKLKYEKSSLICWNLGSWNIIYAHLWCVLKKLSIRMVCLLFLFFFFISRIVWCDCLIWWYAANSSFNF